eukprot:jgi/Botrbrau1/6487/Bobra.0034s0060.1
MHRLLSLKWQTVHVAMCRQESRVLRISVQAHKASGTMAARRIVRGVIFDMDGTLTVPTLDFQEMRRRVGVPPTGDILDIIDSWPHEKRVHAHKVLAEFEDEALADMKIMPGAEELCSFLDNAGLPRGLVTRNVMRSVNYFHEHHFPLPPFFPALDRGFTPYKPSPAAILHICQSWGISPSEAVMVGDSAKDDIVAGNRAGALTILLDSVGRYGTGGEELEGDAVPTFHVQALNEVVPVLHEHCSLAPPRPSGSAPGLS